MKKNARPAECPACAVEAKRRKLTHGTEPKEESAEDEQETAAVTDVPEEEKSNVASGEADECFHICKRCMECNRILPTEHLLDLHIREGHDAMFSILAEKQPMYECFDEECKERFEDEDKRLDHAVKDHGYPKKFRITKKVYPPRPPKEETKKKKKRRSKEKANEAEEMKEEIGEKMEEERGELPSEKIQETQETRESTEDNNGQTEEKMEEAISSSEAAVSQPVNKGKFVYSYKVPGDICFGKGSHRGFNRPKHWHQQSRPKQQTKTDIEKIALDELVDSLEK